MRVELTVTAKGQVTLRQAVLDHLGVKPGERVDLELLPNGRAELRQAGARRSGWIARYPASARPDTGIAA